MLEKTHLENNEERLTRQQQRALHLFFQQLADTLNENGKSMSMVLNKFIVDVPVTKYSVKELIWKPLQEVMFGEKSTTQLLKKQQIDQIYDSLNLFFGNDLEVQIPSFPSLEEENLKEYGKVHRS